MNAIAKLFLAASFVTVIPLLRKPATDKELWGLAKYLPAVGLMIGAVLAAEWILLARLECPAGIRAFIVLLTWVAVTGALHLDGLMDTFDGLFSCRDRERMLAIMRDSRVGTFGAIGGLLVLLGKFAALQSDCGLMPVALFLIPSAARLSQVLAIGCFPYARDEGMGKIWHESTRFPGDAIQSCLPLLLALGALSVSGAGGQGVVVAFFSIATGWLCANQISRILSGHTGDTYGAVVELAETSGLLLGCLWLNSVA